MPWRAMSLRGTRVLVRVDDGGNPVPQGGRVEVRYSPRGGKAYRAAPRNLAPLLTEEPLLPDDHCDEASPSTPTPPKKGRRNRTGSGGAGAGAAAPPPTIAEGRTFLVYADGACRGNPGPAGLGVVAIEADRRRELSEYLGRGTNNIAELTAILRAVEEVDDPSRPVRIYTDSGYAIGVLQKGWKAKANQELVAKVRRALGNLTDVELIHVPGHAGVPLNERADELARAAVDARAGTGWIDVPTER